MALLRSQELCFSWSQELCCPVCQDYFRDPVILPCSHSFCSACLQSWFASSQRRNCPVCKAVSRSKAQPPRNLVLKNLCDAFRQNVDPNAVCRPHAEMLRLYCYDHGAPICIVCRYSAEHLNHRIAPLEEVADMARADLKPNLEPLREKLKRFREAKAHWEQAGQHLENQAQKTVEIIRGEFGKFRAFLDTEEEVRVSQIHDEKELKTKVHEIHLAALNFEINAMESTLTTMEEGLNAGNASLLLGIDALRKTAQRPLPHDPELALGGEIDVVTHLGNLRFKVWSKMQDFVTYTPVVLNPNTSHGEIHTSEDLTSVKCVPTMAPVFYSSTMAPHQSGRMKQHRSILGHRGFCSGNHSWEVEVGDNHVWGLGVISEQAQKNGDILSGLWMVRHSGGKYEAFSPSCCLPVLPLKNNRVLQVRVQLDWDNGKVSFWDSATNELIHMFRHTFKDKMFPYVNTWGEEPLKMVPLRFTVVLDCD